MLGVHDSHRDLFQRCNASTKADMESESIYELVVPLSMAFSALTVLWLLLRRQPSSSEILSLTVRCSGSQQNADSGARASSMPPSCSFLCQGRISSMLFSTPSKTKSLCICFTFDLHFTDLRIKRGFLASERATVISQTNPQQLHFPPSSSSPQGQTSCRCRASRTVNHLLGLSLPMPGNRPPSGERS